MIRLAPAAGAAAALALALAACAPVTPGAPVSPSAAPARQCFLPQTVVNFRSDRDTTAYLRAGRGEVYQLQTGGCRGLTASRSLTVTSTSGGGGRLCVGETVGLHTEGPSLQDENNSVCAARILKRLTAEEVAALPDRLRP
ncbi:MAG: hypothetical protein KKE42_03285 [Alphaproteobacteria bacterium]|uniref:DUF6491 family protein n=1 Tax=Brevundimonas sp. TaxID=1871086 RepID=UPI0017D9C5BD|nr:DUF6491 family protein [Brevundimonas sp.]MBU3971986.1 hypothetical protein [Alphaproteobacteria bacterium]MBA3048797.1 hypothetical protein [Brevundimonas sp.]MBU3972807.1 hypothetical protein [Alphaproteobacteria bacterium]MBU4039116.1 hypothetical protein [Alphaproteobacteria bacterium]MBU4137114.1 hypothetical protein [Alphaproteobacteria bacterium]